MRGLSILTTAALTTAMLITMGCGRSASRLLRQGQLPVYDFPMYLSEGSPGNIWRYQNDGSREIFASGLNDVKGLATDRFGNLYAVEAGNNRVLRFNTTDGSMVVVRESLQTPSVVATDSFGDAWVAQDASQNVIRANDGTVGSGGTYSGRPSALTFTVGDRMIVGIFDTDRVFWGGTEADSFAPISEPVNATIDATGRIYVAEGLFSDARVYRYNQDGPNDRLVVADSLAGPQGIAVDPVGNIYIIEVGTGRIVLVLHTGALFTWTSGLVDPQYVALTQY